MKKIICILAILLIITSGTSIYLWTSLDNTNTKLEKVEKEFKDYKDEQETKEKTEETNSIVEEKDYDTSAFETIKASNIASLSENSPIVLMIGRSSCYWCIEYAPVLASVSNELNFTAKYIDLESLIDITTGEVIDTDSYNYLYNLSADIEYETFMEENFGATPLTIVIFQNKITKAIAGYVDETTLKSTLRDIGFSN